MVQPTRSPFTYLCCRASEVKQALQRAVRVPLKQLKRIGPVARSCFFDELLQALEEHAVWRCRKAQLGLVRRVVESGRPDGERNQLNQHVVRQEATQEPSSWPCKS